MRRRRPSRARGLARQLHRARRRGRRDGPLPDRLRARRRRRRALDGDRGNSLVLRSHEAAPQPAARRSRATGAPSASGRERRLRAGARARTQPSWRRSCARRRGRRARPADGRARPALRRRGASSSGAATSVTTTWTTAVEGAWDFLRPYLATSTRPSSRGRPTCRPSAATAGGRRPAGDRPVLAQEPGAAPPGRARDPRARRARSRAGRTGRSASPSRRRHPGPRRPRRRHPACGPGPAVEHAARRRRSPAGIG